MLARTLVHAICAVIWFFAVNWIGRHSYGRGYSALGLLPQRDEAPALNAAIRIGLPWAFLILTAAVLYAIDADEYVSHLYIVAVMYVIFRWLFNGALGRARLMNWPREIALASVIVGGAWVLYDRFIQERVLLLPDPATIVSELWLVVAGFLFYVFNQIRTDDSGTIRRKRAYVMAQAQTFLRRYGVDIRERTTNERLISVILAIMVYENFNRPGIARLIEYGLFPFGKARTLGIMQVTTDELITSRESVRRGVARVVSTWESVSLTYEEDYYIIHEIARSYNPDSQYITEIWRLSEIIQESVLPTTTHRLSRYEPLIAAP